MVTNAEHFMRDAGNRRRGGRQGRKRSIESSPIFHRPTLVRNIPFLDLLDDEGVDQIHEMAMRIIEEIGIEFRDPKSISLWKKAGADVDGWRVRAGREMLMELLTTAPQEYVHRARNPERSVTVGGENMVFAPAYGMPFVRDLEGVRRNATLADLDNVQKLTQMARAVHVAGGPIVEIMDVPIPHRHLHTNLSSLQYSDKPIIGAVTAASRAVDTIKMMQIVFSESFVDENTVTTSLINSTSPLVWDANMLQSLHVYAVNNQAVICAPFSMAGASTPASPVGTMAVVTAENVMAIALTQLIRPGTPALFGCPAMTVSLRTGAPVFGCPDSALIQLLAGMMARRYNVPHRAIANCATAKTADIYAGYDSMWGAFSAMLAGANWTSHAGGVVENTMTLCFSKLMLDYEQMDAFFHFVRGVEMEKISDLVKVVQSVGPGGHYLGTAHTRNSNLFEHLMQDTKPYDQWVEEGSRDAVEVANSNAKEHLARYVKPPLDQGIEEALVGFIAKRTSELPANASE